MVTMHSALDDVLGRASLFSDMSAAELAVLKPMPQRRDLKATDVLFKQGDSGDSMVVLVQGTLVVRRVETDGQMVEVARLAAGEVVGEMSCLDPAPRSATVAAATPAVVYALDRNLMTALKSNAPSLSAALLDQLARVLTRRLRSVDERISEMSGQDPLSISTLPSASMGEKITPWPFNEELAGALGGALDLSGLKSLSGFSAHELAKLKEVASPMVYPRGAILCREGEPGDQCFVIARGQVEVVKQTQEGERVLASLKAGTIVGQLALLDAAPRSATVRSSQEAVVLPLARDTFRGLLAQCDPMAFKLHERITVAGIRQLRIATAHLSSMAVVMARNADAGSGADDLPPLPPSPSRAGASAGPRSYRDRFGSKAPARNTAERRKPLWQTLLDQKVTARPSAQKPSPTEATPVSPSASTAAEPAGDQSFRAVNLGLGKEAKLLVTTALGEWSLSLAELDNVEVRQPDGVMSAAEKKARGI